MAYVELKLEYRTRLAIAAAKAAFYATRWCAGPEIASAIAWRVAWHLTRWRIEGGAWQRLSANA